MTEEENILNICTIIERLDWIEDLIKSNGEQIEDIALAVIEMQRHLLKKEKQDD